MPTTNTTQHRTYEDLAREVVELREAVFIANQANARLTGQITAKASALRREAKRTTKLKRLVTALADYLVEEVIDDGQES
jgi:hypothetical protein